MISGWLGEGRHQSHPSHPRARDHTQPTRGREPHRPQHVELAHPGRAGRGPRTIHVPDQYRPHEKPGTI